MKKVRVVWSFASFAINNVMQEKGKKKDDEKRYFENYREDIVDEFSGMSS